MNNYEDKDVKSISLKANSKEKENEIK